MKKKREAKELIERHKKGEIKFYECGKCGVYYPKEKYYSWLETLDSHKDCERNQKTKEIRDKATNQALGSINKIIKNKEVEKNG